MGTEKAIRSIKWLLQREENGQTLVEYVLLIGLFSIALITSVSFLQGGVNTMMNDIISVVDALV